MDVQSFYGKGPHPLPSAGSPTLLRNFKVYTQFTSVDGPYYMTGGLETHFNFMALIFSLKPNSCIGAYEISRLLWEVFITVAKKIPPWTLSTAT